MCALTPYRWAVSILNSYLVISKLISEFLIEALPTYVHCCGSPVFGGGAETSRLLFWDFGVWGWNQVQQAKRVQCTPKHVHFRRELDWSPENWFLILCIKPFVCNLLSFLHERPCPFFFPCTTKLHSWLIAWHSRLLLYCNGAFTVHKATLYCNL